MRNKLGNQIIGTGWKGRMVFRAYKVPANPNTLAQQANRDHSKVLLQHYQSKIGSDEGKAAMWNTDALPRAISGYNLMMKLGRKSSITCDTTGTTGVEMAGGYTVSTDISTQGIYVHRITSQDFEEVEVIGALTAGGPNAFAYTPTSAEEHVFWLVDARSKTIPPVEADQSSLHNAWNVDTGLGQAVLATCNVSAP